MPARRVLVTAVGAAAVAAIGLVLWLAVLQPASPSGATFARVGAPAPQISLPKLDGSVSDLNAERGKVVLVNFWATWCEPCRSEMPALQGLSDELQGQPFTIYAVDLQEDAETIEPFLRQIGWQLPVMVDDDGNVTRAYGVRALPATFLIDQQGVLRQQRLGPLVSGGAETAWSEAWLADQVRGMLAS
jgi:thiol-disulfide isomerase/thioredoxin